MAKPAINILSQLQQQGARIGGVSADSRALRAGDAFVAYPGAAAISAAAAGDIVLIAGKGHEDCQESAGRRIPFLDAAVAAEALAAWSR